MNISPVLQQLHWLPVKYRVEFKILLLTYKALHNLAPQYLNQLLHVYTPSRALRSSSSISLVVPRIRLTTVGARSYSYAPPPPPAYGIPLPLIFAIAIAFWLLKHVLKHIFLDRLFYDMYYWVSTALYLYMYRVCCVFLFFAVTCIFYFICLWGDLGCFERRHK